MTQPGLTGPVTHGNKILSISNAINFINLFCRCVAIGAKDMTTRIYGVGRYLNFGLQSLGSHRDAIVACFFEEDSLDITTIGR